MLFTRQRLLLTLLDALGQSRSSTDFQKLLFLYTKECEESPSYEFVPYRFGGFSHTSYADKRRLIEAGLLEDDEKHWTLTEAGIAAVRQQPYNVCGVAKFVHNRADLHGDALIADVYRSHPYYATRNEIVERIVPEATDGARVQSARPRSLGPGLVTVGYEGKSLERYLNQLLYGSVALRCDVRRNPLIRKYGFSKGSLSESLKHRPTTMPCSITTREKTCRCRKSRWRPFAVGSNVAGTALR